MEESTESVERVEERNPHSGERGGERLSITSGTLVVIDQFMLANEQLYTARSEEEKAGASAKDALLRAVHRYGGAVLELAPDTYQVLRDAEQSSIALVPTADESAASDVSAFLKGLTTDSGAEKAATHVFIDTRCVVFIDAALLSGSDFVSRYTELRRAGNDKAARDFVREQGGAVRYGFNKYGDELGAFVLDQGRIVALWPDIAEN